MAGSGHGVTPMSRLSESNSTGRRRKPGKILELSSSNGTANNKKRGRKRKTLSSRYTPDVPPKRRKLGIGAVKEPLLQNNREEPEAEQLSKWDKTGAVKAKSNGRLKSKVKAYRLRRAAGASSNTLDIKISSAAEVLSCYNLDHSIHDLKGAFKAGSGNQEVSNSKRSFKSGYSGYSIGRGDLQAGALNLSEPSRTEPDVDGNAVGVVNPESVVTANTESRSLNIDSKKVGPRKRQVIKLRAAEHDKSTWDIQKQTQHTASCRRPSSKQFPDCEPSDLVVRSVGDYEAAHPIQERCSTAASPAMHTTSLEGRLLRPRKHSRKESEDRLPPWDYVGKRVVVYWPHAKAWFAGKVMRYDDSTKKHDIKYDDGDEESILFRRHKVILERQQPLSPSAADRVPVSRRVSFTKGVVEHSVGKDLDGIRKPVHQAENGVQDDCVLDDGVLLSDVARRHGIKGGPVRPVGTLKRVDAFVNKDLGIVPQVPRNGTSSVQTNIGESEVGNGSGGKAGLVYVRRTKNRQKGEAQSNNVVACRSRIESDCMDDDSNGILGQEMLRKRKKSKILFRQADENDLPPSSRNADLSPGEQAPRKRNKKSLSRLIRKVSVAEAGKVVPGDSLNGKAGTRPGRKRGRKHKLADLFSSTSENMVHTRNRAGSRQEPASASAEIPMLCDVPEMHTPEQLSEDAVSECTIHLLVPVVSPILFSWQLFNILASVKLCEGGPFDGRFCLNGSHQDWVFVFQRAFSIIKAMPLSAWANQRCGRLWQCRILHELWVSLLSCGAGSCTDFLGHLPTGAMSTMVEYLRSAHKSCMLSSRQALNLLVCYFLKPYVIATACEKGAPIKVRAQQFLLLESSKCRQIMGARESIIESFPLQLGLGGGDSAFLSYLAVFRPLKDWSSEGLFVKQMEDWIAVARDTGHTERIVPVTSIKTLNHLGWQVTTAHISIRHGASEGTQSKLFNLGQGSASLDLLRELVPRCLHPVEAWNMVHRECDWPIQLGICGCLCKALLCVSTVQKALLQAVQKSLLSVDVSSKTCSSKIRLHSQKAPLQVSSTSALGDASLDMTTSSGKFDWKMPNVKVASMVRSRSDAATKRVKVEPDAILSRRNSSITTESNGAAVKEESSVDMYSWQHEQSHGVGPDRSGLQVVALEQSYSRQIDKEYYAPKRSKDTKKVKKHRPHQPNERPRVVWKEAPAFCSADIVVSEGGTLSREKCARVELQMNASGELMLMACCNGKVYEQKVAQGSSLAKSAGPELRWESVNGWALEFPDKQQWKLFRCMYNDSALHNARAVVKEIPIPSARPVAEYHELMSPAPRSPHAIRYYSDDEVEVAFKHDRVLYDLDTEDDAWLHEVNVEGNGDSDGATWPVISDVVLERLIDRLEKESYRTGNMLMDVQEAVVLCRDLGVADNVVQAVHSHWLNKRRAKGKPLLRYFQPPLWEQYQRDLSKWEAMMESCPPNMQSQLLKQHPRPVMSAFCLQSRSLDVSNRSKRVLRQRSQRKIKPSVSSSEESQRVSAFRNADSGWQLAHGSRHMGSLTEQEVPENVKLARLMAVEARRVAVGKAAKSQRRFLEFDAALQRAWALLLDYEVATGGYPSAHDEVLEARMACLFGRCSSLLRKGDNPADEEWHFDLGRVGEDFLQAFSRKCSIESQQLQASDVPGTEGQLDAEQDAVIEEASPLLPISIKDPSYAWNGSSLL